MDMRNVHYLNNHLVLFSIMEPKVTISLNFKIQPTSEGYLAQGIEIPAIIIESPNKIELDKDLDASAKCYFKSFPEQVDKFVLKNEEKIEKVDITI